MNKKQLEDELNDLMSDLENVGDFGEIPADELRNMHNSAGKIITALEDDKELAEKISISKFDMKVLKELAVFTYKAIPHRERLDEVVGSQDVYDYIDLVQTMIDNLD